MRIIVLMQDSVMRIRIIHLLIRIRILVHSMLFKIIYIARRPYLLVKNKYGLFNSVGRFAEDSLYKAKNSEKNW